MAEILIIVSIFTRKNIIYQKNYGKTSDNKKDMKIYFTAKRKTRRASI